MSDRKLTISFGSGEVLKNNAHLARITGVDTLTWDELAARLTQAPPVTADKSSAGWYCCASFRGRHRDSDNLIARHCLALDYDHISPTQAKWVVSHLDGFAYVAYTTASHTPAAPRLRIVLPLSRPVDADTFQAVSRAFAYAQLESIELPARESHTPAQMMYLPTVKPGMKFTAKRGEGVWVDVDTWLDSYVDWTDKSSWPTRREHDTLTSGKGEDPLTKPGVIGAFNRAFSITDSIVRFELPFDRVR